VRWERASGGQKAKVSATSLESSFVKGEKARARTTPQGGTTPQEGTGTQGQNPPQGGGSKRLPQGGTTPQGGAPPGGHNTAGGTRTQGGRSHPPTLWLNAAGVVARLVLVSMG